MPAQAILKASTAAPRVRSRPPRPPLAFAQLAQGASPLLAGGAFDDEDAVEVVGLVLDHARLETLGLVLEAPAAQVATAHPHGGGTLDRHRHARQAETTLVGHLGVAQLETILGLTSVTGSSSTS